MQGGCNKRELRSNDFILLREIILPKVSNTNPPLTKLGTVVVTVERKLVPNCSDAIEIKTAQYPADKPRHAQIT